MQLSASSHYCTGLKVLSENITDMQPGSTFLLSDLQASFKVIMCKVNQFSLQGVIFWVQGVPSCPTVWVIWAETASLDPSPSLLLGYALLTSRRESALFLRMATGFGFAQVSLCTTPSSTANWQLQALPHPFIFKVVLHSQ